jgi:hypothetical protein
MRTISLLSLLLTSLAFAQDPPLVKNPGFETTRAGTLDAAGLYGLWKIGDNRLVPADWQLNSHYWGRLEVRTDGAQGGESYVRFGGRDKQQGHIYQPIATLEPGKWYRVSLWTRGAAGGVSFYHYFKTGPMGGGHVGYFPASSEWRRFVGYYQVPADNFASASLSIAVNDGQLTDVDDIMIEPLSLPPTSPDTQNFIFENDTLRFGVSPQGLLREFTCKPLKRSYLGSPSPIPMVMLFREGRQVPTYQVTRAGNLLKFSFLDPDLSATIRITPRPTHFLFEVVDVQPGDVDELVIQLPIKRLAKIGGAFGATYDDEFGACFFCASVNSHNRASVGQDTFVMGGACEREHQFAGAKFVLIGTPAAQFRPAVVAAEKANGLPCPIVGGKWLRDAETNRKSYLFATGSTEAQVDTLIQYAKVGGFGTIIFLKNDWAANHGHFDINTNNYPDGLASLQRAVKKIHAAGLEAGVHVFGPSISPDDPWITPVPHPSLAGVKCPPLAQAMDDKTKTLTLTGQAKLPPVAPFYRGFPGSYIQIGEEIIHYGAHEPGDGKAGSVFANCVRGALGTKAAAHAAGEPVKGLLTMWGFFAVDPDSALADELTTNFAKVFNACQFDMCYFDASDGVNDAYMDRWYYLNKMHLGYWEKIGRPVLYQTSNGTGTDLCWHIIPRSASADGHGDIKGYLDERWPGILNMGNNWIKADIGWYYWFRDVRPDQIEYVCTRALGIEGSISMETSVEATERLAQSRQMYEMIGRWERARKANVFPAAVKAKLLEMGQDFKVFPDGKTWRLFRAAYEAPLVLDALDGRGNVFTINNDLKVPCALGFELVRQGKGVVVGDYNAPAARVVEAFDETKPYYASETNKFEQYVMGDKKRMTPMGVVYDNTEFEFGLVQDAKVGANALRMKAVNKSGDYGWTGIGRRFDQPLDLRGFQGAGVWLKGDAKGETIRIQLRDVAGRNVDFLPVMNYEGWRLHVFPLPPQSGFDWSQVAYLLLYFNGIPPGATVEVVVDDLKLLPKISEPVEEGQPVITINGKQTVFPCALPLNTAISYEGFGSVKFWPGGFKPGQVLTVPPSSLQLRPGPNTVTISWSKPAAFPGNLQVLLCRVWPMEK